MYKVEALKKMIDVHKLDMDMIRVEYKDHVDAGRDDLAQRALDTMISIRREVALIAALIDNEGEPLEGVELDEMLYRMCYN